MDRGGLSELEQGVLLAALLDGAPRRRSPLDRIADRAVRRRCAQLLKRLRERPRHQRRRLVVELSRGALSPGWTPDLELRFGEPLRPELRRFLARWCTAARVAP